MSLFKFTPDVSVTCVTETWSRWKWPRHHIGRWKKGNPSAVHIISQQLIPNRTVQTARGNVQLQRSVPDQTAPAVYVAKLYLTFAQLTDQMNFGLN